MAKKRKNIFEKNMDYEELEEAIEKSSLTEREKGYLECELGREAESLDGESLVDEMIWIFRNNYM